MSKCQLSGVPRIHGGSDVECDVTGRQIVDMEEEKSQHFNANVETGICPNNCVGSYQN